MYVHIQDMYASESHSSVSANGMPFIIQASRIEIPKQTFTNPQTRSTSQQMILVASVLQTHCRIRASPQSPPPNNANQTTMELRSESADSNGSVEGLRRQARVRCLTEAEKDQIRSYEKPEDMEYQERKRQLAALDRRMKSDPGSLPPGVLAKYQDAYGSSTKKFELLSGSQELARSLQSV